MIGACPDIYFGRLPVDAIPEVVAYQLRVLRVDRAKAARLARAPQQFVQRRPLPLSSLNGN